MKNELRHAAFAGILAVLLFFPSVWIEQSLSLGFTADKIILYDVVSLLSVFAVLIFCRGYLLIGKKVKNKWLFAGTFLTIAMTAISTVYNLVYFSGRFSSPALEAVLIAASGAISVVFGIGILGLKKKIGGICQTAGGLDIIGGFLYAAASLIFIIPEFSVLLLLSIAIFLITNVLEVAILFKAARVFSRRR